MKDGSSAEAALKTIFYEYKSRGKKEKRLHFTTNIIASSFDTNKDIKVIARTQINCPILKT